jgi:hypothetical protein
LTTGVAIVVAACTPGYEHTARTTFAEQFACPDAREHVETARPPAEVAADRERAELWSRVHHQFAISGCGHAAVLACQVTAGDAMNPWVDCTIAPSGP